MNRSTHEEFLEIMKIQDEVELAAVAYHFDLAYGRGIILLSNTGEPKSYLIGEQITDKQLKFYVMSYDPLTTILVLYPAPEGDIVGAFSPKPGLELASILHKKGRSHKDGPYHGKNSTRLIRIAEIKFYESILQVALDIVEKLHDVIAIPYRRDVLQLAIRIIGQSKTLYQLGAPSASLIPRLGSHESVVDISSISSIFRTIIEAFLTMHEVFFEPKDENDFEFFHSRWMLIGLNNIKKHTPDYIYNVLGTKEVEPLRLDTTRRMKKTKQYQDMLSQKKNNHKKAMDALIHRNRDSGEWERIARSANIDVSAYQKMYSAFSGYVHSDGYTSHKLSHSDAADFDFLVEFMLFFATRIISKMIYNFTQRYQEADEIAKSSRFYCVIKHYARKVAGD